MMDLTESILKGVCVHFVGNKSLGQELIQAKKLLEIDEKQGVLMATGFLSRFNAETELFSFSHPVSLSYNEVYNFCLELLAGEKTLLEQGRHMAQHLYDNTVHPKIKNGELYVCHFENCIYNSNYVEAVGIFKTEHRSHFMNALFEEGIQSFTMQEGVELGDLDKGCLVFPTNAENGFDVYVFDTHRGEEAAFWKNGFLNLAVQANEYFQTNQFLTIAKEFIAKQAPQELELSKTDQIDLLNRSVEYFRGNETFDKAKFEQEVFYEEKVIESFRGFEQTYKEEHDIDLPEQFDISSKAVKKQARVFKSVLKLDRNFHVYIHGDKSLIEKGYDEKVGKHFYKIYFDEEID